MKLLHNLILAGGVTGLVSLSRTAVAIADDYIDFGMNEAACKSAARQAKAAGSNSSHCYETGPGHYTLYFAD